MKSFLLIFAFIFFIFLFDIRDFEVFSKLLWEFTLSNNRNKNTPNEKDKSLSESNENDLSLSLSEITLSEASAEEEILDETTLALIGLYITKKSNFI